MRPGTGHSSILRRFAIFTVAGLASALLISFGLSYTYYTIRAAEEGREITAHIASILDDYLEAFGYDRLFLSDDTSEYFWLTGLLTEISYVNQVDFLCLYEVDQENEARIYLMSVSPNEEIGIPLQMVHGFGEVEQGPLLESELLALDGTNSRDFDVDGRFAKYGGEYCMYHLVKLPDGHGDALLRVDFNMQMVRGNLSQETLAFIIPLSVAIFFIAGFEVLLLRQNVVAPMRVVSARMREFAQSDVHNVTPLEVKRDDEVGEIASSFNQMVVDIEHYVDRIEDMTEERVSAATELDVAKRIQQGLVPANSCVEGPGFEAFGFARTARKVGGDFYDLFALGDGRLALVIADVSGKGIIAALAMSMIVTLMHEKLVDYQDPARALNATNDRMIESNPECMFVTAFAAVYDPVSCMLTYANAGHTPPLVVGGDYLEIDPGIALGLFEDADIANERIALQPGAGILVYTDGATEAVDGKRTFFGMERLREATRDAHTAQDTVHVAVRAIDAFVGDAEQFDDLTMAALFACVPDRRWEATLPPELSSFSTICDHVIELCGGKKNHVARHALLACDEALANIVAYSGATAVEVVVERVGSRVVLSLSDDGVPFDPLEHAAGERTFEEMEFGGMGISFIMQSCDAVTYAHEGGRNVLTMTFEL